MSCPDHPPIAYRHRLLPALLLAAALPASARGQPVNPVYVDDAPRAWELFRLAREQAAANVGEAIRLYQELLDEAGEKLIPRQAAAGDEFVSVRRRVLADLRADRDLLDRYRLVQSAEAERLFAAGELLRLARTRSLTEAGLRATLTVGQEALESARFWTAITWLEPLAGHPDLTPDRAAHCWFMIGVAAYHLGDAPRRAEAERHLAANPRAGAPFLTELRRLEARAGGPEVRRGVSALDHSEATDLTDLVAQTIWSVDLEDSLLRRRTAGEGEGGPPPGYERRRQHGELTTTVPTVAGTTIYVNEGHTVRALDRFTGRNTWEQPYQDRVRSIDGDNSPVGDLSVVAVEGDALVTLTGHAYAGTRSGQGRVICLDARTGAGRWATSLDRLGGHRENEGLFPHGAPIIAEGGVYVLARKVTPQMLTGCYVVALDLETGAMRWIRHVASSGAKTKTARPFSTLLRRDGRLYVASAVGAIACLEIATGDIVWLRRYTVPVHIRDRRRQPWEMGGPVVVGDRLIALTPDQRRIVVLDRATGETLETHEAAPRDGWNGPAYLLASEDESGATIYGIGSEVRAFRLEAMDRPAWRLPAPARSPVDDVLRGPEPRLASPPAADLDALTLVGRAQMARGMLVIPTMSGVLLVDDVTGHVSHRLGVNRSGNPLALGAQLILAGADTLEAYMPLARAEQMLRSRIAAAGDDPDPALSLLQLGMRVGTLPLALEGANLALRAIDRVSDPKATSRARRELFTMLLELHRRQIASTDEERQALYGMIGAVAATAEQRVEHLLAWGDGVGAETPDRAVEIYQTILSDPVLAATVRSESGLVRPAASWAARRLAALIHTHGPSVYAPQSDFARTALEHIQAASPLDEDALTALAMEFPFADAAAEAALLVAGQRRQRGAYPAALAVLSTSWHLAPHARRSGRLLGDFIETCLDEEHPAAARSILAMLAHAAGHPPLVTSAGPRDPAEWLADLAPTGGAARRPRVQPWRGRATAVARRLPGRLRVPDGGSLGPDRALLLDDTELRLVGASDLKTIWSADLEDPDVRLLGADAETLLLWLGERAGDPRITALDAAGGRRLWTTPQLSEHLRQPLVQMRGMDGQMPDGMPFDPRQVLPLVGERAVYLLQRTGGVLACDRGDGHVLWTADRTLSQVHHVLATAFGLVLVGMDREIGSGEPAPRLLVLEPDTGEVRRRIAPLTRTGVVWAVADPLGGLACGTAEGIELIDLSSGRRPWTNIAADVTESRRGWSAGGSVLAESRSGTLLAIDIADGEVSAPFETTVRGQWERDALRKLHVHDDRIVAQYRDRIIRYDRSGNVDGADIITEPRDYKWLLEADGRWIVVSQHDSRQVQISGGGDRRTQRTYRVYVISENGALQGEMLELPPITRRLRAADLIDGWLLVSTDLDTFAIPLGARTAPAG